MDEHTYADYNRELARLQVKRVERSPLFVIQDGYRGAFIGYGSRYTTIRDEIRTWATREAAERYLNQEVPFELLHMVNTGLIVHEVPNDI